YLTLPGGHRVGVAGRVLSEGGRVLRFREVAALNFRVGRAVPGCADGILPRIWDREAGLPHHTVVVSPPGAGKTTLLRDLVRQLSTGVPRLGIPGLRVSVVDERSEIAACQRGQPRHDLGPRTDVLDACPKAVGIQMAIRALSPQVIVFDELGGADDAQAVLEAAHAGVRVVTSAHAWQVADLERRPSLAALWAAGVFGRIVLLDHRPRPGTVRAVVSPSRPDGRRLATAAGGGVRP
ncbi:MAG TPA: stage III sporulation protein AA, partial [Bacillota bacterium]